jgi:hypothetical protein
MVLFIIAGAAVIPYILFAQSGDTLCDSSTQLCPPTKFTTIQCFFKEVLRIAAEIGAVVVVCGIIYSGFLFVSARGNAEQLVVAKRSITYTVIGGAIVLGAWSFSVGISNTMNTILNGNIDVSIKC